MKTVPTPVLLVGGAVALVVGYVVLRGFKGAAKDAGKAVVDTAAGAVEGVTVGLGNAVGIPATDVNECEKAIREGRTLDASFACPLGRFAEYMTTGK